MQGSSPDIEALSLGDNRPGRSVVDWERTKIHISKIILIIYFAIHTNIRTTFTYYQGKRWILNSVVLLEAIFKSLFLKPIV